MAEATKKKAAKKDAAAIVRVRLVKSGINRPEDQKATLAGLGLTRMQRVRELEDTPSVRGMINKVKHLVEVLPAE
jgi:large subunit ribosomal protein L30